MNRKQLIDYDDIDCFDDFDAVADDLVDEIDDRFHYITPKDTFIKLTINNPCLRCSCFLYKHAK